MSDTAAAYPILECSVSGPQGVQALTVGDKRQLQCKIQGTSLTSQSQIQFAAADKDHAYSIQFLGGPRVAGDLLVQDFTSYRVGTTDLNSVFAKIDGKIYQIPPFRLEVKSVLPQSAGSGQGQGQSGTGPTPYPMVDPLTVRAPLWWWVLWIGLVLILGAWAVRRWVLWRRAHRKAAASEVKELTSQEKFQQRLRKLESQGLHRKGEYKKFALELTNIVKIAIGAEFKFPAEDQTTEELLFHLERRQKVFFKAVGGTLRTFLADLDQIKFAKTETSTQGCEMLLDQALIIGRAIFPIAPSGSTAAPTSTPTSPAGGSR